MLGLAKVRPAFKKLSKFEGIEELKQVQTILANSGKSMRRQANLEWIQPQKSNILGSLLHT